MTSQDPAPPSGFIPYRLTTPMTQSWGTIYVGKAASRLVLGAFPETAHCNARGVVHDGYLTTLADDAMGLNCGHELVKLGWRPAHGLVSVSLSIDFMAAAQAGEWLEFETRYLKVDLDLCFAQVFVMSKGLEIARADGKYRPLAPRQAAVQRAGNDQ